MRSQWGCLDPCTQQTGSGSLALGGWSSVWPPLALHTDPTGPRAGRRPPALGTQSHAGPRPCGRGCALPAHACSLSDPTPSLQGVPVFLQKLKNKVLMYYFQLVSPRKIIENSKLNKNEQARCERVARPSMSPARQDSRRSPASCVPSLAAAPVRPHGTGSGFCGEGGLLRPHPSQKRHPILIPPQHMVPTRKSPAPRPVCLPLSERHRQPVKRDSA